MAEKIEADASPEKRFFVELITKDITLADAFLDLVDNSINAVIEPFSEQLSSASDYERVLLDEDRRPSTRIDINVSASEVVVFDDASGIPADLAKTEIFKFGRSVESKHSRDRLSVYGIGLKRAMFKMGRFIRMVSDHVDGGFSLDLDVKAWESSQETSWHFDIEAREPVSPKDCGTRIEISGLLPEMKRRIEDQTFIDDLKIKLASTYSFFIGSIVDIHLNGEQIEGVQFQFGDNYENDSFFQNGVSCSISAGISVSEKQGRYTHENAGWHVFCNGRTVVFADKTRLTGWTGGPNLPVFQPKHRPFIGVVFFVAEDPESLPWTTTKSSIDQEASVWQTARRRMVVVGKVITSLLDERYRNDDTQTVKDLQTMGGSATNALKASSIGHKSFDKTVTPAEERTRIQFDARKGDVKKIANYLRKPRMSGSEVGRYVFEYFLRNKVDEND